MINNIRFYMKAIHFLLSRQVVSPEAIQHDYDRLSPTYDVHFSEFVGKHSRTLIQKLNPLPGNSALDLACGTGTLSLAMAKAVGPHGSVTGADRSIGMLAVAMQKQRAGGFNNIRFIRSDVRDIFSIIPDKSLDFVTCGWAIGYVNPKELIRHASGKLRPGGKIGIIENVRHTLLPVRNSALRVARTLPQHFKQVMDLHLRLPRDKKDLSDLFAASNLEPDSLWEGEEDFEFKSGGDVLNWVLHTGASAGFDKVMDQKVRRQCDELFVQFIEEDYMRDGVIKVAHRFVAGIARKED